MVFRYKYLKNCFVYIYIQVCYTNKFEKFLSVNVYVKNSRNKVANLFKVEKLIKLINFIKALLFFSNLQLLYEICSNRKRTGYMKPVSLLSYTVHFAIKDILRKIFHSLCLILSKRSKFFNIHGNYWYFSFHI